MKTVMNVIGFIGFTIDLLAVIIQMPYIIVSGCIASCVHRLGVCSKVTYVWLPSTGVHKVWKKPNGDTMSITLTYKELFN